MRKGIKLGIMGVTLVSAMAVTAIVPAHQSVAQAKAVTLPKAYRHIWRYSNKRYHQRMVLKTYAHYAYFTDAPGHGNYIKYRYVHTKGHKYGTISVNGTYESVGLNFKNSRNLYLGYDVSTLHFTHR